MQTCCSSTLLVACSLLLLRHVMAMPTTIPAMTTLQPKLVTDGEEELLPKNYHFIVEHRPTSLGQNHYIKPGQVVGAFSLDSNSLRVRHEGSKRNISKKLNILFVADPKEDDAMHS
ncbi:hypothetical protein KR093_003916 [Drosophila rubida]|uniref:Uncharacterized protein n=1 Tax=Drosophila rubida TaxID=30044 RepID=A0AAD4KB34_9MUSC|nr:hypothetical protein KR093_003916 [Drosophila rubida]